MNPSSNPPSGTSTPRAFTSQAASAEDLLKTHTVGLVNLAEFRKRRADALELKEKEIHDGGRSGTQTPNVVDGDGALTPPSDLPPPKKRKKKPVKGLLSFGEDDEEADSVEKTKSSAGSTPHPSNVPSKKLTPNPHSTLPVPKAMTKAALAAEATERDRLRREFLELQEKVKNTDIAIPFVFYDGSNIPGGIVKLKKGDHIWLILERARKVGAEQGVAGTGTSGTGMGSKSRDDSRKQWARVGVDDLLCVRGDVIVPHHYEIYYFITNKTEDPTRPGRLLFDYSGTVGREDEDSETGGLRDPKQEELKLEGRTHDPSYTKVVDRRWYEKNKHIFPASTWKEFKVGKEFEELAKGKKDAEGNAFFYS